MQISSLTAKIMTPIIPPRSLSQQKLGVKISEAKNLLNHLFNSNLRFNNKITSQLKNKKSANMLREEPRRSRNSLFARQTLIKSKNTMHTKKILIISENLIRRRRISK